MTARQARHGHGVPVLRAVPASHGLREHRLRRAAAGRPRRGPRGRRGAHPGPRRPARASASVARRSCPAGSSSASRWRGPWSSSHGCCSSTSRSPTSMPSCASRCAPRSGASRSSSAHVGLRDPRPGRGHGALRRRRGHERRSRRAGRHARRHLSPPRDALRGRLHRPRQLPARSGPGRRRQDRVDVSLLGVARARPGGCRAIRSATRPRWSCVPSPSAWGRASCAPRVRGSTFLGSFVEYELQAGDEVILAVDGEWMSRGLHAPGEDVAWSIRARARLRPAGMSA